MQSSLNLVIITMIGGQYHVAAIRQWEIEISLVFGRTHSLTHSCFSLSIWSAYNLWYFSQRTMRLCCRRPFSRSWINKLVRLLGISKSLCDTMDVAECKCNHGYFCSFFITESAWCNCSCGIQHTLKLFELTGMLLLCKYASRSWTSCLYFQRSHALDKIYIRLWSFFRGVVAFFVTLWNNEAVYSEKTHAKMCRLNIKVKLVIGRGTKLLSFISIAVAMVPSRWHPGFTIQMDGTPSYLESYSTVKTSHSFWVSSVCEGLVLVLYISLELLVVGPMVSIARFLPGLYSSSSHCLRYQYAVHGTGIHIKRTVTVSVNTVTV